jgi:hypothetical protein
MTLPLEDIELLQNKLPKRFDRLSRPGLVHLFQCERGLSHGVTEGTKIKDSSAHLISPESSKFIGSCVKLGARRVSRYNLKITTSDTV